jgi:hypothetical protein
MVAKVLKVIVSAQEKITMKCTEYCRIMRAEWERLRKDNRGP